MVIIKNFKVLNLELDFSHGTSSGTRLFLVLNLELGCGFGTQSSATGTNLPSLLNDSSGYIRF